MANGGESVCQLSRLGGGIADPIGRKQWEIERTGEVDRGTVASFFFTLEVTLQFDIDVLGAEDGDELIDTVSRLFKIALLQSRGQWAIRAAGEADEAFGVF